MRCSEGQALPLGARHADAHRANYLALPWQAKVGQRATVIATFDDLALARIALMDGRDHGRSGSLLQTAPKLSLSLGPRSPGRWTRGNRQSRPEPTSGTNRGAAENSGALSGEVRPGRAFLFSWLEEGESISKKVIVGAYKIKARGAGPMNHYKKWRKRHEETAYAFTLWKGRKM